VLNTQQVDGRTVVAVRCACGTHKLVNEFSLKNGRTRSCGGAGCKAAGVTPGVIRKPLLTKRMFDGLPAADLRAIWANYPHRSGHELAEEYDVPIGRLYRVLRAATAYGSMSTLIRELKARGFIAKEKRPNH
jgi:hypothetical protein